ncbi:MAG TPA: hypothetical protein VHB79_10430 [Polyangiaceae bacterium]|nr:hypothetical protein [Polyangiaceae bacterium]
MSWSARIEHVDGGLAIQFAEPLSRLQMTNDVAAHFAALIAIEARSQVAGVGRTLETERPLCIHTADAHPHFCDCLDCMSPGGSNA